MSKKTTMIAVSVYDHERESVNEMARRRGFKITSDYLRSLIEADAKAHGEEFHFEVNRGGYRERLKEDGE